MRDFRQILHEFWAYPFLILGPVEEGMHILHPPPGSIPELDTTEMMSAIGSLGISF